MNNIACVKSEILYTKKDQVKKPKLGERHVD